MKARFIYITTQNQTEAQKIARALVDEELVACVNIIGGMTSIYRWQGQIIEDKETVLIAKTKANKVDAITARVAELHSYDCPCVISLPIDGGNPAYLKWLDESC